MGRINVAIPDNLEREFRAAVARKYGARKGALGEAVSEALRLWLEREKSK